MIAVNSVTANNSSAGAESKNTRLSLFPTPSGSLFAVENLLDCFARIDGRSRLILQRDAKLVVASSGAEEIFASGNCLVCERGYVTVVRRNFREPFLRLLSVEQQVETLAIPDPGTHGHLLLRASAYDASHVCLTLHSAADLVEAVLPNLEDVFGFTPAEASIAESLYRGLTPHEIAEEYENSVHTIRAHIRRCYDKLGVSCREEFWHKLNAYRLT